jgi:carbohydrate kinase (thermoresistant glucokinase family)
MSPAATPVPALIVMGVSGSGKTTLAQGLAHTLHLEFVEGDHLHGPQSIAKMRRGEPLDDRDRAPWLAAIGRRLAESQRCLHGVVISCSALKAAYRDALRVAPDVRFVFLDADRPLIERRLAQRQGHFMPPALIASQFDTLERPRRDETDVLTLPADLPLEELVRRVGDFLARGAAATA